MPPRKVLFATSEAQPLIKTGGLGDVSGALPIALKDLGMDVRIIMPAYREAMRRIGKLTIASLELNSDPHPVRILEGLFPDTKIKVWLVDSPRHFDRPGDPYLGPDGVDWPDNAERFAVFSRAVTALACNRSAINWKPDIVHCNDWQSALIPAMLVAEQSRPATVFTVHNLAYQGIFPAAEFWKLGLPAAMWSMHGLEFYGKCSYIKAGLVYADLLNTVSPTYAREICTPAFGNGLDPLLNARAERLTGILNGADYTVWDPARDPHIAERYSLKSLQGKATNKTALQKEMGLPIANDIPVIGLIGRLVEQKGIDIVLDALPALLSQPLQIVILGSGERRFELALNNAATRYPTQLRVTIGFNERLAHRIECGADMFLMPSRFEPCGLNQMYSLRYGTVPIVRQTGGLADTVTDATPENLKSGKATGFVFVQPTSNALTKTVNRALELYARTRAWRAIMETGMSQDFGWTRSAKAYRDLYQQAVKLRNQTAAGIYHTA